MQLPRCKHEPAILTQNDRSTESFRLSRRISKGPDAWANANQNANGRDPWGSEIQIYFPHAWQWVHHESAAKRSKLCSPSAISNFRPRRTGRIEETSEPSARSAHCAFLGLHAKDSRSGS